MSLLRCPCGREGVGAGSFVGQQADSSGFHPVLCGDGEIVWLCPEHAERALVLAAELLSILKNKFAVPPALRPRGWWADAGGAPL